MGTYQWEKATLALVQCLTKQTLGQRKTRFLSIMEDYAEEVTIIYSLSVAMGINSTHSQKRYNNLENIDFEKDVGFMLFNMINGNKLTHREMYFHMSYSSQLLGWLISTKVLSVKFTETFLLSIIPEIYTLPKLITMVTLPNLLESGELFQQGLSRNVVENTTYPFYFINIPKKVKRKTRFMYLVKEGTKVISSTNSSAVRDNILQAVPYTQFGIIGLEMTAHGYQKKREFIPLYISEDVTHIKDLYRGVGDKPLDPEGFDTAKFFKGLPLSIIIGKTHLTKVAKDKNDIEEFLQKARKHHYVVFTKEGVTHLKPVISYHKVPIIDFILDENYEALGVVVDYSGQYIKVYFKVPDDLVQNGVIGRYIKLQVTEYGGIKMGHTYNGTIGQWNKSHSKCSMCGTVNYRYQRGGVCSHCFGQLQKTALYSQGDLQVKYDIAVPFNIDISNYHIEGVAGELKFTQVAPKDPLQKPLPYNFEDTIVQKGGHIDTSKGYM